MTEHIEVQDADGRACPLCAQRRSTQLLALTAAEIATANWSYSATRLATTNPARRYPIVRCEGCGFVFASLLPTPAFLSMLYDDVIDAAAARQFAYQPSGMAIRMQYLARLLPMMKDGSKVLDFGCGFGPTLALLHNVAGIVPYGFETSALRAGELRKRFANIIDDSAALPGVAPFAGLILDNVLEHVPDPLATVRSLAQVCGPGAIAYVSVPDMNAKRIAAETALHAAGKPVSMDINPWEHLSYFDVPHLDSVLGGAGFVPLSQLELPGEIRTGLRQEKRFARRAANALATAWRCAKYAVSGDTAVSASARFYRLGAAPRHQE